MLAFADEPSVSAYSSVVMDGGTNTVLYSKNQNAQLPMASTTKVMTCLIACESERLDDVVTITDEMLDGTEGSLIYLKVGDKITLYDLINGALLASGNDAANAIAVFIGGSVKQFVIMMNDRANSLGMENTLFVTPSGLDEGNHHSTAYDMALLAGEAIANPTFRGICSKSSEDILLNGKKQTVYNHNKLLYTDGFVGVKTGFTEKAGRCLISAFSYKDNTIIVVTLNAPNDWQDHKKLVDYAKKQYVNNSKCLKYSIPIVGGSTKMVKCEARYNVTCLDSVQVKAYYYPFIYAPAKVGDKVGILRVFNKNRELMTVDIIVKENVKLWEITT